MNWLFFEKIMQIKICSFCTLHMTKFEKPKGVYCIFPLSIKPSFFVIRNRVIDLQTLDLKIIYKLQSFSPYKDREACRYSIQAGQLRISCIII
jgi:hypothetical protein